MNCLLCSVRLPYTVEVTLKTQFNHIKRVILKSLNKNHTIYKLKKEPVRNASSTI